MNAAHNVETVPTNCKRAGKIIHQLVDDTLVLEKLGVLIVYVSRSCSALGFTGRVADIAQAYGPLGDQAAGH